MVARIMRFFKEVGLTHFAYRNDREPAIMAMIEEACALSGRKGVKVSLGADVSDEDVDVDTFVYARTQCQMTTNISVRAHQPRKHAQVPARSLCLACALV